MPTFSDQSVAFDSLLKLFETTDTCPGVLD